MVNFDVKADFSQVDKMIKRYGQNATNAYKKAITNTSIYGIRELKSSSPVITGRLRNAWEWAFKGDLIAGIINKTNYVSDVNNGWKRRSPIVPTKAKALVFQVGKRTAAKSSTSTMMKKYKLAMKSLNGKGLDSKERAKRATEISGVVVTKRVDRPASFKGSRFIDKTIPKIDKYFINQIFKANERLLA